MSASENRRILFIFWWDHGLWLKLPAAAVPGWDLGVADQGSNGSATPKVKLLFLSKESGDFEDSKSHALSSSFLFPFRLPLRRNSPTSKQRAGTPNISTTTTHTSILMNTRTQSHPAQTSPSPSHRPPSGLWWISLLNPNLPLQPAPAPAHPDIICIWGISSSD